MACFQVISISLISGGDYDSLCVHYFLYSMTHYVFEQAVNTQLSDFVRDHSNMCQNLSGLRLCHSTCTAQMDVTDTILSNMDKGLLTGADYMDLKRNLILCIMQLS